MARPKKITQNINKDAGLMDLPKVRVPSSKWQTPWSNYITSNIGDIVPIYVDEILPSERRRITMGMLSHMTTPISPIMNAQYTEFRCFWIPHRLSSDLLGGYSTRKSPWVKVFGEDPSSTSANVIVPLAQQKLPDVDGGLRSDFQSNLNAFGGVADALDIDTSDLSYAFDSMNFLEIAAYELVYQYHYRDQNREAATNSNLYKWCYNLYNRTSVGTNNYDDTFHKANREKDYFTGSSPFTQKSSSPISAPLAGLANVVGVQNNSGTYVGLSTLTMSGADSTLAQGDATKLRGENSGTKFDIKADLSSATGVSIEQLRIMIKTQELLEKDAIWGSMYINQLNSHFNCVILSDIIEEPREIKKVTITSQMQPIFQTSTTSSEPTILGTIGANATTQSGEFEILPETEFKEYGYLMICAVHKAQNSYDSLQYKPKRCFKKHRFDFYTPELNDLGYQPISGLEYKASSNGASPVGYNEAFAEYRYKFNKVHGMFEPSRANALDYWTLAISGYNDIQSLYKQSVTELDRAVSIKSTSDPQFFDAYGFIETVEKPMSLHSIPGMDGVI